MLVVGDNVEVKPLKLYLLDGSHVIASGVIVSRKSLLFARYHVHYIMPIGVDVNGAVIMSNGCKHFWPWQLNELYNAPMSDKGFRYIG